MRVVRLSVWSCAVLAGLLGGFPGCSGSSASIGGAASEDLSNLPPEQGIVQAASTGDVDRMKTLLAKNPELVNYRGNDYRTPLHFSAAHGHNEAVDYLLSKGADPTVADEAGATPQSTALQCGHPETAKIIGEAVAKAKRDGHAEN